MGSGEISPAPLLQARQLQQDKRLLVRFDWSDLVQQTLLEAHRNRNEFKGPDGARGARRGGRRVRGGHGRWRCFSGFDAATESGANSGERGR